MNGGIFMKKTVIGFILAGALISAAAGSVFAAGARNYTDADRDGICNYRQAETSCDTQVCPRTDSSTVSFSQTGPDYSDKDNNGICDNYSDRDCSRIGSGCQYQHNRCHGRNR